MTMILFWISITVLALSILTLVRNTVTYKITMETLDRVKELSKIAIKENRPWEPYYAMFYERSYYGVMFDLTSWTAKQAYPRLFK
jgi:hypothetical protein